MRKEVSNKMPAASGNDLTPIFRVLSEAVFLKRIDLVANHTSDHRNFPPNGCFDWGSANTKRECRTHGEGDTNRFTAADLHDEAHFPILSSMSLYRHL